jgi:hypothetical protein
MGDLPRLFHPVTAEDFRVSANSLGVRYLGDHPRPAIDDHLKGSSALLVEIRESVQRAGALRATHVGAEARTPYGKNIHAAFR